MKIRIGRISIVLAVFMILALLSCKSRKSNTAEPEQTQETNTAPAPTAIWGYGSQMGPDQTPSNCFPGLGMYENDVDFKGIKVYNRWGQELFFSSDINENWVCHGNIPETIPEGTYYYIITTNETDDPEKGTFKTIKGTITIMRK